MADQPPKDNDAHSNDDSGQQAAEAGQGKRSRWLDSLIQRLDDEEEAIETTEQADGDDPGAEDEEDAHQGDAVEADGAAPEGGVQEEEEEIDDVMMLRSGEFQAMDAPPPPPVPRPADAGDTSEGELVFEVGDDLPEDATATQRPAEEFELTDELTPVVSEAPPTPPPVDLELEEPHLAEPPAAENPAEPPEEVDLELEARAGEEASDETAVEAPAAVDLELEEPRLEEPTAVEAPAEPPEEVDLELEAEAPAPDEAGDVDLALEVEEPAEQAAQPEQALPEEEEEEEEEEGPRSTLELAAELAAEADPVRIETALAKEIEAAVDKVPKALLQHELGHLFQHQMRTETRAAKAYAQALNLDPLLRPNVWSIARIFTARELWPNLVKLHDAQARFEQDNARRAEILLEKGWVLADRAGDSAAARAAFWAAYEANESWLAPLLALEQLDLVQGDIADLAQVYRHMAETAADPARRVAALMDLARLQDQLDGGTPQVALQLLERARQQAEQPDAVLRLAERIAAEGGLHAEQADTLKRQADLLQTKDPPDPRGAVARLREAAFVARDKLEDPERAREYLETALAIAPGDRLLNRDLLTLAEERGDWERVQQLLTAQMESAEDETERAALSFRLGMAGMKAGALGAMAPMDSLPGYLPVLAEKERRLLATENLDGLVELYQAEAQAVEQRSSGLPLGSAPDPEWAAAALWRAAALLQRHLHSPDRAIEICQHALTLKPGYKPAIDDLEQLYLQTGQHRELADLLEQQAQTAGDSEQTVHLLESLAALCAGPLDDPERLLVTLTRLRQAEPDNVDVLRRLGDVLERVERHAELEQVLQQLEQVEQEDATKMAWKLRRAHLCETQLAQPDAAFAIYREILQGAPSHAYAFPRAEVLLRRSGRYDELAKLLRDAASDALEAERKRDLLLRLATVYRRHLQDPKEEARVYLELLDLKPDDPMILRALTRAAIDANDGTALAEALERELEQESATTARVRHQVRLAEVLQDRLELPDRAEEALHKAIEEAPSKALVVDAIEAMVRRQIARGDYMEARDNLEILRREAGDESSTAYLEEQAWLTAGPLADAEAATELWDQVLEREPQNLRAILGKLRLHASARDALLTSQALSGLATATGDTRLAALCETRAGVLADGAGDPDGKAAAAYRRALELDPDNLEAQLGLQAKPDLTPEEQANLATRLAEAAGDRVREEMRLELAEKYERAGRLRAAGAELTKILEQDPEHIPALMILQRLTQAAGEREQEIRIWIRLAALLHNKAAKGEAYFRAGELLEELGRPVEAAVLMRQALAQRADDEQAATRLSRLYQQQEDLEGQEALLGHRIRHAADDDPAALIALHFERAELRLQRGDKTGAGQDMARVLKLDPAHLEALRQLARLYDEQNEPRRALALYTRFLDATESRALRRPAVIRVAQLMHQLGRTADAVEACQTFLELDENDEEVLEQLVDLYVKLRDFPRAVETLEHLGGLRHDNESKAANQRRIARLHWKELKDTKEARTLLMRARDVDPCNIEVVDDLRQLSQEMQLGEDVDRLLERTKDDLREALTQSPASVDLLRKLMRVAEWHEDTHALLAALGALCLLNAADEQDRKIYRRRMAKMSFEPKRQPGSLAWRGALMARGAKSAFGEIWAVIAETVSRLFAERGIVTDPAMLNVGKLERVDRRAGGPVSRILDPIAAVFGLGDFETYLCSSDTIAGVVADPPVLVVGQSVVSKMTTANRFYLGRMLSLLRDKAFALEILQRTELQRMLAAAVFQIEPDADVSLPKAEVEAEARRLSKALPRKARKALPLAVARFMQEGGELDSWVEGVIATANRAGLLVCGDIELALGELVEGLRPSQRAQLPTERITRIVLENEQAARLLVYSMSSDYLGLRKELQV